MRKFIFSLAIMFMALFTLTANAQVATENAKPLDNTYVTVSTAAATPLTLDNVFPLNPTVGIAVGKWFSPVFGAEVEGTAWLGSHTYGDTRFSQNLYGNYNLVRGSYVGVNTMVNLTNLIYGYNGSPRKFELSTNIGTGWLHTYTPNTIDEANNSLGVKTGLDLAFNLGKEKAHTLSVRPAVLWDVVTYGTMPLQFDKRQAQLQLGLAYTYHFKTSNGTRHFKTYDIGKMKAKIVHLRHELDKKPKEVICEVVKTVEVQAPAAKAETVAGNVVVFFAQNSDVLTDEAAASLENITGSVKIVATASPEGTPEYNRNLSQRRADVVKTYLEGKGVKVLSVEGLGVTGPTSGRVAIVTIQ